MVKLGGDNMTKTKFLKDISKMTREQISELLNANCKRTKLIYPVILIKPSENEKLGNKGE
jgi:mRNA-degrading endonuclease RelE of RelBE toxin-antitoxin system